MAFAAAPSLVLGTEVKEGGPILFRPEAKLIDWRVFH